MATITLTDVVFRYGRHTVLDGLSWQVGDGITGLLGPNGAGKTTLLNLLVGLTRPTSGEVSVHTPDGGRGRVGFVPQRFSLAGEMPVQDTVAYAAWINGVPRRACGAAATRALALVSLDDRITLPVRKLSGGQRQRLGLAAALAHEPDLLVLDEPTVGLDPGQRMRLREVIARVGERCVVLLSTHLIEDISHLCGRVGVLADGRLVFDGTEAELAARVAGTSTEGLLGSDFERSYYSLIADLGGGGD